MAEALFVQRGRHLGGQAAVPRHDAVHREVVQRLVDDTEALVGALGHARALDAAHLVVAGLCAVQLVQAVLLKKQHISHAGGSAGKSPVAAHGHGVAVRRRAAIGEPVGGVAQLAGIDDILGARAAPHPVVVLRQPVEIRHPPLGRHVREWSVEGLAGLAVHGRPHHALSRHHAGAVVQNALDVRRGGEDHRVPGHIVHYYIPAEIGRISVLHHAGDARQGHGVPGLECFPQSLAGHAAVVQQDVLPPARRAVELQGVAVAPRGILGLLEPDVAVLGAFRLGRAEFVRCVHHARSIAGGHSQAFASLLPAGSQRTQRPRCGVKGHLVRPDEHLGAHAHHLLLAVRHGVLQLYGCTAVVRGIPQARALHSQQTVQVVHPVHPGCIPHFPPGLAGLEGRVSPRRKVLLLAQLCLAAGIPLVQPAEYPQELPLAVDLVQVRHVISLPPPTGI